VETSKYASQEEDTKKALKFDCIPLETKKFLRANKLKQLYRGFTPLLRVSLGVDLDSRELRTWSNSEELLSHTSSKARHRAGKVSGWGEAPLQGFESTGSFWKKLHQKLVALRSRLEWSTDFACKTVPFKREPLEPTPSKGFISLDALQASI